MTVAGVTTSCPPLASGLSASGPQLVPVNTVMRVRVLRALSTRGRAQQTTHHHINCCSIHCYSQWESCNRNQGPTLQCCMSCSAAVTRDTTVKSAQARHNLQVSSHHSFSQNCEAHGWDSHNACHSMYEDPCLCHFTAHLPTRCRTEDDGDGCRCRFICC